MSDPTPIDCYTAQEAFWLFYDWYWSDEPKRTVLHKDDAPLSPEDQAARALMQLLILGEIEPLVWEPSIGNLHRITPDDIGEAAFPERPFYGGDILEPKGSRMAKFNGRSMFMRKDQVDRWFASQAADDLSSPQPRLTHKRQAGAPSYKREAVKTAMRKRWPNGIPHELSNAAVQAQIIDDLRTAGGPTVSPRTIDKARGALANDPHK
jgi:hypothetical protein